MNAPELRALTEEELQEHLGELRTEWRDLRFDEAVGKLTNPMRIRQIKREIARVKTIETERRIEAEIQAELAARS